MKNIAILGFSGSIGQSTAAVVRAHPDKFRIVLASAHRDSKKLFDYALEFNIPKVVLTGVRKAKCDVPKGVSVYYGKQSLLSLIAEQQMDILLNAVAGSAGLEYSLAAVEKGVDLALANKETLVMAGDLLKERLKISGSKLLPVDSEHSAIFQVMRGDDYRSIKKLYLTASGGPFLDRPLETFANIKVEDALAHPTWDMGNKISIDSATMLNKALEVIEARHLFDVEYEQITPVVHRQSIVHSMVECLDGSILAQMSSPSMTLPILYAFSHPERIEDEGVKTNLFELGKLSFEQIEQERFPLFFKGVDAGKEGGLAPAVLNSASEAAVALFLQKKISFPEICAVVCRKLDGLQNVALPCLEQILAINRKVYDEVLATYS